MKKNYIILISLIFLLQFSFLPNFFWEIAIPNFLLITTIAIGYQKSLEENVGWFLGVGVLFEIFSSTYSGLSWALFLFFGILVWFFQNFVINKERNFLVEVFFWFSVKILWDIFFFGIIFLINYFQEKNYLIWDVDFFSGKYFLETVFFVASGILIFKTTNFLENKFNFRKK